MPLSALDRSLAKARAALLSNGPNTSDPRKVKKTSKKRKKNNPEVEEETDEESSQDDQDEENGPEGIPDQGEDDENSGEPILSLAIPDNQNPKPTKIDRLPGQRIPESLKEQIRLDYLENPLITQSELATRYKVGEGRVSEILTSAPALMEAASQKRRALLRSDLEQAVGLMVRQVLDGIRTGELKCTKGNFSRFAVLLGVTFDKLQLLTGEPTARTELLAGTVEERKRKMIEVLDRAENVIRRTG